jgi:hypothetical protein
MNDHDPGAAADRPGMAPPSPPTDGPVPPGPGSPGAGTPSTARPTDASPAGPAGPGWGWGWDRDAARAARRAERYARREARRAERGLGGAIWGVLLILIGAAVLGSELIPGFDWDIAWPAILIAIGILFVLASIRRPPVAP